MCFRFGRKQCNSASSIDPTRQKKFKGLPCASAPEPHADSQAAGLLERNHLKGESGDAINAVLATAGHNLRLLTA
jgi:hypothetical protein